MRTKKKIKLEFSMFLRANSVESNPPLSTILGNYGVNTTNFCKEINEFTKELPNYFLLEIKIFVKEDKTFSFIVKEPSTSFLLKLVANKYIIEKKGQGGFKEYTIKVINLKEIYLISIFKFGYYNELTLKLICGTLGSSRYYIICDE